MASLVIGPSSSGKSTFIENTLVEGGVFDGADVRFANELTEHSDVEGCVVHFNLLGISHATSSAQNPSDALLSSLLESLSSEDKVWVLVASRKTLLYRIAERSDQSEPALRPGIPYPRARVQERLQTFDLRGAYSTLFSQLRQQNRGFVVLSSDGSGTSGTPTFDVVDECEALRIVG